MPTITVDSAKLTQQDRNVAREAAALLSKGENIPHLPIPLARILSQVLDNVANGAMQTRKQKLTTTEAADMLNVSRPYLIRLVDEGKIACHRVGTHRRLYYRDVEAYKVRQDARSYAIMQELQGQAQELGLYDVTPIADHE